MEASSHVLTEANRSNRAEWRSFSESISGASVLSVPNALQEMIQLLGVTQRCGDSSIECAPIAVVRLRQHEILLREGASGRGFYVVRSGSFKSVQMLEDGYEQVISFSQPGDLLGFESLHGGPWRSTAVALEVSTVFELPTGELPELHRQCPPLEQAVCHALSRQLARAGDAAGMALAVASEARVGRFILWLSERMVEAGRSPFRLRLRMSRREIASLLGLAHETVSRSFTLLAEIGCLRIENRDVEILDMQMLRERARITRGLQGEGGRHRHEVGVSDVRARCAWWGESMPISA